MIKHKTLRSHTIIPSGLYVERSADAQLQRIVLDMGRPGYILVSRQMGKTNLLLNAKRVLGNSVDKFLYLDVSNTFPEIQQFFRNIVDIIVEAYPELISSAGALINTRRAASSLLPPHKEHELELREILRAIEGRLVICLDEIDALTKTKYADQVFSFIRSIYFSGRVNFPEFERLTYVLSGVAEPTELIKNKDVSPFNIGEKIYLDDFSPDEFKTFVKKAGLLFDEVVSERIYYWASGNPRISWDICSTLEDIQISGKDVTPEIVDSTVGEMYLINYDLPPIDHIRTLVEDDSVIRDAIMSIHYHRSESIPDSVRSRLYLAGITRPDTGRNKTVSIRNRILIESLSENWIQDVERRKLSTLELANKKYEQGLFSDALGLYKDYISSTASPKEPDLVLFKIGNCEFNLEQYHEAISSFEKSKFRREQFPSLYYSIQHRLGLSHLILGNTEECVGYFRAILEQDKNTSPLYFYFDSCLNLSTALFSDFERNQDEIFTLNQLVIESEQRIKEVSEPAKEANRILYVAHYNLARACRKQGDFESATKHIENAISLADSRAQVGLLLEWAASTTDIDKKTVLLARCTEDILASKLVICPRNKEYPLDFTLDICARLVEQLEECGRPALVLLDKLSLHLSDKALSHDADAGEVITKAVYGALTKGNSKAASNLIQRALKLEDALCMPNRRHLMTLGMLLTPFAEINWLSDAYRREFIEPSDAELVETDLRVIWGLAHGYTSVGKIQVAQALVSRVRELLERGAYAGVSDDSIKDIAVGTLLLDILQLDIQLAQGAGQTALSEAERLQRHVEEVNSIELPYFAEDFLSQLKVSISSVVATLRRATTVKRTVRKFGRNEIVKVQFKDGTIAVGKYKKFQSKLEAGECQVAA